MNKEKIAQRFQQPAENLLMKIAVLAKEKEDIIDLSIGDPDLITNPAIIFNYCRGFLSKEIWPRFSGESGPCHSGCFTWDVSGDASTARSR